MEGGTPVGTAHGSALPNPVGYLLTPRNTHKAAVVHHLIPCVCACVCVCVCVCASRRRALFAASTSLWCPFFALQPRWMCRTHSDPQVCVCVCCVCVCVCVVCLVRSRTSARNQGTLFVLSAFASRWTPNYLSTPTPPFNTGCRLCYCLLGAQTKHGCHASWSVCVLMASSIYSTHRMVLRMTFTPCFRHPGVCVCVCSV